MDAKFGENHVKLAPEQLQNYSQKIIKFNKNIERSICENVPVLCSEQTHWKARKMIPLLEYLYMQNVRRPDFVKMVSKMVQDDLDF